MTTVRIPDDITEALKAKTGRGQSVTGLIEVVLRQYLDDGALRAPAWRAAAPAAPRPTAQDTCPPHPPGRILDGICMACGRAASR